MGQVGQVDQIERIGGHVAIDFVNTLGGLPDRPDDEYLFSYDDLLTWTQESGLLDPRAAQALRATADQHPGQAEKVFKQALRLRAALDVVLRAHLEHHATSEEALQELQQASATALAHAQLQAHDDGRYAWTWPARERPVLKQPLWPLAHHAIELLTLGPIERLARCGHCRWLFLDTTKNHSRRWCSMDTCGARMKMRRYRAARRPQQA